MYEILVFIHIVAAMVWVGGGVLMLVLSRRMARADAQTRLRFARETDPLGAMFGISALVLLGVGIAMVLQHDTWALSQTWVWLALVLYVVSIGVGGAYYGRVGKRIGAALEAGGAQQAEADRLTRQLSVVSTLDLALLLAIVWLMVAKPGV